MLTEVLYNVHCTILPGLFCTIALWNTVLWVENCLVLCRFAEPYRYHFSFPDWGGAWLRLRPKRGGISNNKISHTVFRLI